MNIGSIKFNPDHGSTAVPANLDKYPDNTIFVIAKCILGYIHGISRILRYASKIFCQKMEILL